MMRIKLFFQEFSRNRLAVLGSALIALFVIVGVLAPVISIYDPFELSNDVLVAPSSKHPLGTDNLGRDVFSRIIWGARVSLFIGFVSSITSLVVGIVIGGLAGYIGGIVDEILMRITDAFSVIPSLLIGIVLCAFWGPSIWLVTLVIGLTSWSRTARLVRADFLSVKELDFVEAARALGANERTIIFGEIFPNVLSSVLVMTSFQVGNAILTEAALSFMGLADLNFISWGYMITMSRLFILNAPWCAFFPGFCIFLIVFAANVLGDGLTEISNPKLRKR